MKQVLIIGKDSYIGEKCYSWIKQHPDTYCVDIVSPLNGKWKEADFTKYDCVVDFAGIAHINNITEDMRGLFFSVNRDLTIELAKYSKEAGVKQFILFSSMNVYGDMGGRIADLNATGPTSFYGQSKYEGDIGAQALADNNFKVASVRPPFVYGKGCKGNYNSISNIAKKTPIFPEFSNKKSMIYVDNLCEFIRLLVDSGEGGVYAPQNKELVSTADLVREIAKVNDHKIWFTKLFNWGIYLTRKKVKSVSRAFENDCYDPNLSDYWDYRYSVVSFSESIKRTEK